MTWIVGIDPGASGALAFFDADAGDLEIHDMPALVVKRNGKLKREISVPIVAGLLRKYEPTHAYLELVGARPGQGVSSMYQFGRTVGMLEGCLGALMVPTTLVAPQRWQKFTGTRGGKGGARLRAAELFPAYATYFARAKDDGRADAALIAWWGCTK